MKHQKYIQLFLFSIIASFSTIQTSYESKNFLQLHVTNNNGKQNNSPIANVARVASALRAANSLQKWDKSESWDSIQKNIHPYEKDGHISKFCLKEMIKYAEQEESKFKL